MPTTVIDKLKIKGLSEETSSKPILVYNPTTKRVYWQTSPNERITALENKTDSANNFKYIPNPGYSFNVETSVLTMLAGWVGTINNVDYTNDSVFELPAIPLASEGKSRIDLIIFKTDTTFERVSGPESIFTPIAPIKPANTLNVTFLTVSDASIDVPETPTPKAPVTSVNGQRGDVVLTKADIGLNNAEEKTNKGVSNGYVPLDEFAKITAQYLNIVNDLFTGGATALASAETVKMLKGFIDDTFDSIGLEAQNRANGDSSLQFQIDDSKDLIFQAQEQINGINLLLTSNDVDLDTVQEIVDAIKTVETSLSTILVNNLTTGGTTKALTAEMGKTLKGLIDALTTTVANLSFSVITTTKPILSTALASQNVAGMVAYINALSPVLVVASNEIVKFNTTDTGRIFELKLRGRSFGVGQAAITANDVLEVTEFLNKDITLSNYPSTRNDGQLPTNRILSTDATGNLKLYTMATSPAPWIRELIPDSYLPDTTGNIRIYGDFFTPAMCDRVNNPTAIILGGVTVIHYATFVSSQEILINVTTGSVEGTFSCTLDNGLSTTKANALLIVLGTVYKPILSELTIISGQSDLTDLPNFKTKVYDVAGTLDWNKVAIQSKNYSFRFNIARTPFGNYKSITNPTHIFSLVNQTTANEDFKIFLFYDSPLRFGYLINNIATRIMSPIDNLSIGTLSNYVVEFRKIGTILYLYLGGVLVTILSSTISDDYKAKYIHYDFDFTSVKFIELN